MNMDEPKKIHRAKHVRHNGDASALCFKKPRRIDLKRASWTIVDSLVTCEDCKAAIAARTEAAR